MPANPNSPNGFKFITMTEGVTPTYGTRYGMLNGGASGTGTQAIYQGDVLLPPSGGYFFPASTETGGGVAIGGIFDSCEWYSISQQKTVRQNYWPGTPSDANGDITIKFIAAVGSVFEVQCQTGPITQGNFGMYANFAVGTGTTHGANGVSGFTLDDSTLTNTAGSLPFRIYRLPVFGPSTAQFATAGFDPTQQYNRVWVEIANLSSPA